jgi:hypothetical protein
MEWVATSHQLVILVVTLPTVVCTLDPLPSRGGTYLLATVLAGRSSSRSASPTSIAKSLFDYSGNLPEWKILPKI